VALTRRRLLTGGAAAAAGAALAGCGDRGSNGAGATATASASGGRRAAAPPEDLSTWAGVRRELPLDPRVRQFSAFLLAGHPRPVREAIERHRALLDLDPEGYLRSGEGRADPAGAAARYLGGARENIALTTSTTMGLAILYRALRLGPREEILSTVHDHFATDESLRLAGGRVRRVRLYDPRDPASASADEIVSRLRAAIRPRTRAVAITWVHSGTGVKLPIDALVRVVRDAGERRGREVLLCVDGVHALGAEDVRLSDPARPGIDFFAAGCHKWLMGPRGTGVLWGTRAAWGAASHPLIPSFANASYGAWIEGRDPPPDPPGPAMTPGGFQAYEHRWALPEAFAFHERIGRERVTARIHALAARMKAGLAEVRGLRLVTPRSEDLSAGLVCAKIAGVDPGRAVAALAAERISATVTPYAARYLRFGCGLAVDEVDVDAAVAAVARIARRG
jgi:selenocysteine lyase/cysteine desulfurase